MIKRSPLLENAAHWKQRASETRQLAEDQVDGVMKRALLDIAAEFDNLAELADGRRKNSPDGQDTKRNT
jgi:hypothetical protein